MIAACSLLSGIRDWDNRPKAIAAPKLFSNTADIKVQVFRVLNLLRKATD